MRCLIIALIILKPFSSFCQPSDSPLGKGSISNDVCMRWEAGWNRSWFTSLGISYVYSNINAHMPNALVVYAAAEANLAPYRPQGGFYAFKAGIEGSSILAYGLELRNNTDFKGNHHLVFTPKIGISIFGYTNLFYGYNVFRTKNNLFGIYHHQVSLSLNLNRRIIKDTYSPVE